MAWFLNVDELPRPDSLQPVERVYTSFARYFVFRGQDVELICLAGSSRRHRSVDVPSWVVDWSYTTYLFPSNGP
jgi:hypothetical protein